MKHLRETKQMTQKDLAEELKVTPQTISKWELNKSYPDLDILLQLSNFFQVTTDELLGNTKPTFFKQLFAALALHGQQSIFQKFWNLKFPIIYQFTLLTPICFANYPELSRLGTWRRREEQELELVLTKKSITTDPVVLAQLFQVITNLRPEQVQMTQIYQIYQ